MRELTINEYQNVAGGFNPLGIKDASVTTAFVGGCISACLIGPGALAVMGYELYLGAALGGALCKALATTVLGATTSGGVMYGISSIMGA